MYQQFKEKASEISEASIWFQYAFFSFIPLGHLLKWFAKKCLF
jgi:hypothetical protein